MQNACGPLLTLKERVRTIITIHIYYVYLDMQGGYTYLSYYP